MTQSGVLVPFAGKRMQKSARVLSWRVRMRDGAIPVMCAWKADVFSSTISLATFSRGMHMWQPMHMETSFMDSMSKRSWVVILR